MNIKNSSNAETKALIAATLLAAGIAAAGGVLAQIQGPSPNPDRAVGAQVAPAPSSARRPIDKTGAIVIPRENCGTYWTGWVKDPKADANPCPANCERGERLGVRESKNADGVQYQANYRCHLPEFVVNQPRRTLSEPGALQRTNCGTHWTARQDDPNTDVNPCPANCERGELVRVSRGRSGDKLHYEMNFRCYVAQPQAPAKVSSEAEREPAKPDEGSITFTTPPMRMTGTRLPTAAVVARQPEVPGIAIETPPMRMTGMRLPTAAVMGRQPGVPAIAIETPPMRMTGTRLPTAAVAARQPDVPAISIETPPMRMTGTATPQPPTASLPDAHVAPDLPRRSPR